MFSVLAPVRVDSVASPRVCARTEGVAVAPSGNRVGCKQRGTNMRKTITATALAAALTVVPVSAVLATTPPSDPNDDEAVDNPLDENDDDSGFDDWGLLGLLGLVGLAGLAGRKRQDVVRTYDDRTTTR